MAKKKQAVNKAQAIRDYFAAHPDAKGTEVVAALKAQSITVAPAQVSNVKTAGAKKKSKPGRKPGRKPGTAMASVLTIGDKIRAAVALLGVSTAEEAHHLIDALANHRK